MIVLLSHIYVIQSVVLLEQTMFDTVNETTLNNLQLTFIDLTCDLFSDDVGPVT